MDKSPPNRFCSEVPWEAMVEAVACLRAAKAKPFKTVSGREFYVAITEMAERIIPADIK